MLSSGLHLGLPGFDVAVQNDMLFWIGDLNYRINMQNQQVVRCAKKGQVRSHLLSPPSLYCHRLVLLHASLTC